MKLSGKWGARVVYAALGMVALLAVALALAGPHTELAVLLFAAGIALSIAVAYRADKALRCPKCGGSVYGPARQAEWTAGKTFFCPHCGEKITLE
ncbi:MAG TPA: hypothetical protein PK597_04470 [Oscillospiraceae bacterium]|nr:hypothetical protein [Oscillospiraceae bacterium]